MSTSTILSDNGVSSGTTGLKTAGGDDGTLVLQTTTAGGTATTAMTINTSQNVGIGVTPSTYSSGKAIEIGAVGNGYYTFSAGNSFLTLGGYYNSGWKYSATSQAASQIEFQDNLLIFKRAASGTAGNTLSWSESMRIDSSGNVGIGTSSPTGKLDVRGDLILYQNANSTIASRLANDSTGAAADSQFYVQNSANTLFFGLPSTGFSTSGLKVANTAYLYFDGANGINIGATNGSGLLKFYTGGTTERARITSGGEVYIAGTTDQGAYNLQCNGTGVWGAGAYVNGSDARIKEDVAPIDSGLDVVEKLNPVTYRYKEDWSKDQSVQTGFIAQELLVALDGKNYVDGIVQQGGAEGYYSVAYQNIIPILTKAIQELNAKVEAQAAEIAALKGINNV